jgi:hypothetical protein
MPVYDFRPGRSIRGLNPQAIGERLEAIRAAKGKLTAEDILEDATQEDSPLHNGFEWNDAAAGHQHRLNQARKMVVSIRVLDSPAAKPTIAYVSVRTPDKGRSYVPTIEALSDADLRQRFLVEARTFIESMERRYAHLLDVSGILDNLRRATA